MYLFDQPQHFHESLEQFISSLHTKNFKISDEISSKCNMEKNCFVLTKKPRFCEKFGSQIKFCAIVSAYVIYEWYLSSSIWKPGLSWISLGLEAKKVFKSWRLGVFSKTLFITIESSGDLCTGKNRNGAFDFEQRSSTWIWPGWYKIPWGNM